MLGSKELYNTVITRRSGERFSFSLNTLTSGISEVDHRLVQEYTQFIFGLALEKEKKVKTPKIKATISMIIEVFNFLTNAEHMWQGQKYKPGTR